MNKYTKLQEEEGDDVDSSTTEEDSESESGDEETVLDGSSFYKLYNTIFQ